VGRVRLRVDERSTWKLLVGIGAYATWAAAVTVAGAVWFRLWGAAAVVVGMPVVGMVGLVVRERWRGAWRDVRRFFLLRSRRALVAQLREQRSALGARVDAFLQRTAGGVEQQPTARAGDY